MVDDRKDIQDIDDIRLMVDTFYGKIRKDTMLSDIFNNVIQDRWPVHLNKMYRFWQTVLLDEHTYYGSPFVPHAPLPVEGEHFDRWVVLFNETVDTFFKGDKAEKAKWLGKRMADMFLMKIQYIRGTSHIPLK